jgi:hypothetical protein
MILIAVSKIRTSMEHLLVHDGGTTCPCVLEIKMCENCQDFQELLYRVERDAKNAGNNL